MPQKLRNNVAVVIGSSMAGLLTARILSNHFTQVILLERDQINDQPEARKGQPQTRHLHGLLAKGLATMQTYFPTLVDDLRDGGAIIADMGQTMRWHISGGYRCSCQERSKLSTKQRVKKSPHQQWKSPFYRRLSRWQNPTKAC